MTINSKRKLPRRGTRVPAWLQDEWKWIPGTPQSETIEGRARHLIQMQKEEWLTSKPNLLQALALDLMCACFPESHPPKRQPPDAVKQLMLVALALPPEHEVGNWTPDELERRGGSDREVLSVARLIERLYKREFGTKILTGALVKELELAGHKVAKSTIRTWRTRSTRTPSWNWFTGDDPGEFSRELVRRWRTETPTNMK